MNIYQENGFKNRTEYLQSLAEEYQTDMQTIFAMASLLGKEEDFDALLTSLEDFL